MKQILLDTCALIWVMRSSPLRASAQASLDAATEIFVSPISAWEIGLLVSRGRITLTREPRDWFNAALQIGVDLAPMPHELLISASFLPGSSLRDPADRIVAATARWFGYRLMTRNQPLLAFGDEGHVETIPC